MVIPKESTCYGCASENVVLYEHNGKMFCADCYEWRVGHFPKIGDRQ